LTDIIICEFMDTSAVERLRASHDVIYDSKLVDEPERLAAGLATARALIVRNRTQLRGALLAAAEKLEAVGRLGVGLALSCVDDPVSARVNLG
jgi:(S)-sulfolactate dehydrogenase